MGFGFFRGKKNETEITEMRVLDDGKQHMGNRGEGAFGIIAAAYIPA